RIGFRRRGSTVSDRKNDEQIAEQIYRSDGRSQGRRGVMRLDRGHQVAGPPVVQEKHPLSDTPQRRRAELVGSGEGLDDIVREPGAHVMDQKVRVQIDRPVLQDGAVQDRSGLHLWRMTETAADVVEYRFAPDGARAWIGGRLRG